MIPCFESAHFVADAVESVLDQQEPDIEIIVVDDGSSDPGALRDSLGPFGDVVTLIRQAHSGLPVARNRGISEASGALLAFLDADDCWKPGFLARQLSLLRKSGADLVYCDAELFGPDVAGYATVMDKCPSRGEASLSAILTGECVVVMSTVVARADSVRAVGGFEADLEFCEDLDLWIRMLAAGSRFVYHRDALASRRLHDANMSTNRRGMLHGALKVFERHVPRIPLERWDRVRVDRRLDEIRSALRLETAKSAIAEGNLRVARGELWAALQLRPQWKPLVVAVALGVAPGPTLAYLQARQARNVQRWSPDVAT